MKKIKRAIAFSAIFAMALGVGLLISNNKKQVEAKADITDAEPVSDLHLDQDKIRRVSVHYETMIGHDGSNVTAYVAEGAGNLYPVEGNNYMPEMRFMNAASGGDTKVASDPAVTNVHFWYKIENNADLVTHDSEIDGQGYCLQVVKAGGGYPKYNFEPITDGEWHSWLMNINAAEQDLFAGIIVQAGDLDGSIVIANFEINGAYEQLSNVVSFASTAFNYDSIDNFEITFNVSADVFNFDNPAYTGPINSHYQDHATEFMAACGADIMNTITVNGKTLQYWKTFDDQFLTYPRTDGVSDGPMMHGGQYSPVSVEFFKNKIVFKLVLEYFPMTSIEIGFLSSFKSVSGGVTYETNNDLVFKSTLLTDGDGRHPSISFQQDLSHELSREFHITNVALEADGQPKYQRFVVYTDVPRDTVKIFQAWPHDNYRYIFDDLLIDGVSLTHYACWARGNSLDFDDSWKAIDDYVTETPIAGNRNYNTAVQPNIVTDQVNYVFRIRIPMKLYADLDVDWANAFSIREGALWMTPDGPARNSALDTFNKSTSKTEVNITNMTVSQANNGTGRIELHTDVDVASIGYNFSDKSWEDCCLDMFRINSQSIRDFNASCTTEISYKEYNLDYFNAYGVIDGAAKPSKLTQPIIVHCETKCIVILVHPKVWTELKTNNIFVSVLENTRVWSDSFEYFNIKNDFSSSSLDYFLGEITDILDGAYSENALASVKAKLNDLPTFAKNVFDNNDEYTSYRATVANWELEKYKDDANAELMNYKAGEFREKEENDRVDYINAAALDIADATTTAAVDTIVSDTKALIDNLKTAAEYDAEELAGYKEAAVNELNNYKNEEDYLADDWQEIQGLINSGVSEINAATNKQGVDDALSASKALINAVPNKEARELDASKLAATAELNAIDTSIYREEEKAEVESIISTATANINNATSKEDVATLLANAKAAIALIKTDAQKTAEELAEAKVEAKNELESYKNDEGLFREAEANRRLEIVNSGNEAIDNAENKDAVNTALANAKGEIDALKTAAQYEEEEAFINAKAAAKKEIEDYATAKGESNYSTRGWAEIQSYVDTGKQSIDSDNCNTQAKINQIVSNVKSLIDTVPTKDVEELEAAKNNAINDLREYYNNIDASKYTQENVNKLASIKDDGERAIEAATSIEAVNSALADAKAKLDAVEKVSPSKSNSCGGNIMATSLILSSVALIGITLLVLKKRKEY